MGQKRKGIKDDCLKIRNTYRKKRDKRKKQKQKKEEYRIEAIRTEQEIWNYINKEGTKTGADVTCKTKLDSGTGALVLAPLENSQIPNDSSTPSRDVLPLK